MNDMWVSLAGNVHTRPTLFSSEAHQMLFLGNMSNGGHSSAPRNIPPFPDAALPNHRPTNGQHPCAAKNKNREFLNQFVRYNQSLLAIH